MQTGRIEDPCENRAMGTWYGLDTANARLRDLRPVLEALRADRDAVIEAKRDLERALQDDGGAGGTGHDDPADRGSRIAARRLEVVAIVRRMEDEVRRIDEWGVTLRDIGSGLVDFPALVSGRPVWLCWKLGEPEVGWWHELETGMAGRRPLGELR
jgi:hypothetical protein